MVELRQRQELRRLLIPELNQSLKILALPLLDLKAAIQEELLGNPVLEELPPKNRLSKERNAPLPFRDYTKGKGTDSADFRLNLISKKLSLQDILLRQLGMFTNTDEDYQIGYEIIGNIDENGYLKATLEEIANTLKIEPKRVENVLKLIQRFEPAGIAARSISECLLLQLDLANQKEPLLRQIIESHLDDLAKKKYSKIAKALNQPIDKIKPLLKRILQLDPKPGRNYSSQETQQIIPDITIYEKGDDFEIIINDEDIPTLNINKDYKQMLKNSEVDSQTKDFLTEKLKNALALMRAVFRRKATLRRIMEAITEIQSEAIKQGLSHLKPLTFTELAKKLQVHESTVCRAIMNKYVRLHYGVVALKQFFSSSIKDQNGQSFSSTHIKRLIKELIEQEDKKHPLSDQEITDILAKDKNLMISRRTVAKYREELKILSSSFRRER